MAESERWRERKRIRAKERHRKQSSDGKEVHAEYGIRMKRNIVKETEKK